MYTRKANSSSARRTSWLLLVSSGGHWKRSSVANSSRLALIHLLPCHNRLLHGNPSWRLQVAPEQPDGLAGSAPEWTSSSDWRWELALP